MLFFSDVFTVCHFHTRRSLTLSIHYLRQSVLVGRHHCILIGSLQDLRVLWIAAGHLDTETYGRVSLEKTVTKL